MTRFLALFVVVLAAQDIPAVGAADISTELESIRRGDFKQAIQEVRPLAGRGDARAQYLLGTIYLHGYVDPPAPGEAARWIERAAKQNYLPALSELARMYRNGDGVERDEAKTAYWYGRAAELGDVGAQLFIADSYAYGIGVPVDRVEAYKWYQIAMQYWGSLAVQARDVVAAEMSRTDIERASKLAAAWLRARAGK